MSVRPASTGVTKRDVPRVLLIWPGGMFTEGGNFGVPQILNIAQCIRARTNALVRVLDLDMERQIGPDDIGSLTRGFDVVGISCYSSFDYLKVMALARLIRAASPKAWLVTGGYHPSARPGDFTRPGSPFSYVVVGDGEMPLARLVADFAAGRRPLNRQLGPEPLSSPDEVMPYDWSLLDRYRPRARKMASQAEIYLSRGCPYDCSFCMERAKRETSWRSLTPESAVEELHRLDAYLDLSGWTLRVVDALFGMKRRWRREFLEALVRRPLRARKIWLLIRLDLVEREDFELMARANVSPGFGLETGDPTQLRRIRKTGMLSGYLDKMMQVAEWARETHVPFGANVIAGHPGETEASLKTSARFMEKLFLNPKGTLGFLSVDPFRMYPGSPIDEGLADWRKDTGMRVHRYPWWEDGDQDFLSEWVDPSDSLDYARRERLTYQWFAPIVEGVRKNFAYQGPAPDYFKRALDEQIADFAPRRRLRRQGLLQLWQRLNDEQPWSSWLAPPAGGKRTISQVMADPLADAARDARAQRVRTWGLPATLSAALIRVPRQYFVPIEEVASSDASTPVATASGRLMAGFGAYAHALAALALQPGECLLELAAGTGYGASLGTELVGDDGYCIIQEPDDDLLRQARALLSDRSNVALVSEVRSLAPGVPLIDAVLLHDEAELATLEAWRFAAGARYVRLRAKDGVCEPVAAISNGLPGQNICAQHELSQPVPKSGSNQAKAPNAVQFPQPQAGRSTERSDGFGGTPATLPPSEPAAHSMFDVRPGSGWADAVFHVLAHIRRTQGLPSSLFDPAYVRLCEFHLGAASSRELAGDAWVIAEGVQTHEQLAELQTLAWLFDSTEHAQARAELSLAELTAAQVVAPEFLPLLRRIGPVAEVLWAAALLELDALAALPPMPLQAALVHDELQAVLPVVPELRRFKFRTIRSLGSRGRVYRDEIWLGQPSDPLSPRSRHVAWQAAHEATVAELRRQDASLAERAVEQQALSLLAERAGRAGLSTQHRAWRYGQL